MNLMEKETAPHIRAYCVKELLQKKLFNTDVIVHSCDAKNKPPYSVPHSAVLLIYATKAEEEAIERVLNVVFEDEDFSKDIPCWPMPKGNPRIDKYLSGDF